MRFSGFPASSRDRHAFSDAQAAEPRFHFHTQSTARAASPSAASELACILTTLTPPLSGLPVFQQPACRRAAPKYHTLSPKGPSVLRRPANPAAVPRFRMLSPSKKNTMCFATASELKTFIFKLQAESLKVHQRESPCRSQTSAGKLR